MVHHSMPACWLYGLPCERLPASSPAFALLPAASLPAATWCTTRCLQAFAALQRVVRHSFLEEFLQEAILKLPTFRQHSLGNLLRALGAIGEGHRGGGPGSRGTGTAGAGRRGEP